VSVWDTPGYEKFNSELQPGHYRSAIGAFVMFDLTNRDSYVSVAKWINEIKEKASRDCMTVLIGNKCDRCIGKNILKQQ
jgi:GTPase SAR1 family protein